MSSHEPATVERMYDTPHILMCPPEYFGIEYEINPWMNRERQCDHDTSMRQWEALAEILKNLGATIELMTPQPGLPDLVFTANAGLVFGRRFISSRFRHAQRQGEEPHFQAHMRALGFQVETLPPDYYFEGAGDALFCGETLFAGYRIRSTARSLQEVAVRVRREVIVAELVDPRFYHLDTCFCPVSPELAIWYPPAFDEYGQTVIRELIPDLIELEQDEAVAFGANAVVVGTHVVSNIGCAVLADRLAERGYTLIQTPLTEFLKAGGAAKCLTLRLDGEEAFR